MRQGSAVLMWLFGDPRWRTKRCSLGGALRLQSSLLSICRSNLSLRPNALLQAGQTKGNLSECLHCIWRSMSFFLVNPSQHSEQVNLLKCFNPLNVVLTRFFARPSFTFVDRPSDGLLLLNPVDVRTARDGKLSAIGTRLIGSVVIRGRWSD